MIKKRSRPRRITISRTEAEWNIIHSKISSTGKDFNSFMRSEIYKLTRPSSTLNGLNEKPGDKLNRCYIPDEETYKKLDRLRLIMGNKPISTILDQFILSPLLLD